MSKAKKLPEAVDQLYDALNTLADFEKFHEKLLEGRYGSIPDLLQQTLLAPQMDSTKAALVHHVIGTANAVVEVAIADKTFKRS